MAAAIDTNVLLPVLRGAADADLLIPFLDRFIESIGLVICGPVYAELAAAPGMRIPALDQFFAAGRIAVDLDLTRDIWLGAAASYRSYADRRLAAGAGWPRRILA